MKNVLVPTDFSEASLELVDKTAKAVAEKINIFLFHAFEVPAGQKTVYSHQPKHNDLITETLRQRCRRIKANNKNITNISVKILQGGTHTAFSNFTETHKIDLLVLPRKYIFTPPTSESVNPVKLFKKSGIEKISTLIPAQQHVKNESNDKTNLL